MLTIKNINYLYIFNSHVERTIEFEITMMDGSSGVGSSPKGETISIYENKRTTINPEQIITAMEMDGILGKEIDQVQFDNYLIQKTPQFGTNNTYALSLAFYNATNASPSEFEHDQNEMATSTFPRICFNILNGGWHAYTNPVLSDFPEYLLVAKSDDLEKMITLHNEIQQTVKEKLLKQKKTVIAGNPVNSFATKDNRECIDFLLNICEKTGTSSMFDLMIDASATDLWTENGYKLSITNQAFFSGDQFLEYWMGIIKDYGIRFLEDPFFELDEHHWQKLTTSQQVCHIIGDNFYTSDSAKILVGAEKHYTHGVIIKPNQAGTITAVRKALATAKASGQIAITSHRSVSTESTFLSKLTCLDGAPYIKIGPLLTDYSSVLRLNAMIRIVRRNAAGNE